MAVSAPLQHDAALRQRDILRFWHKVEFFIPFDLEKQVLGSADAEWSVRTFSASRLQREDVRSLWQPPMPADRRLSGFEVYLGLFDKSELVRLTQDVVEAPPTAQQRVDEAERGELEGPTCFARLKLNQDGEPLFDEFSVSTVPWALGVTRARGLAGLDSGTFATDTAALKFALRNVRAAGTVGGPDLPGTGGEAGEPRDAPAPLSVPELLWLVDLLCEWADYRPPWGEHSPLIVIRVCSSAVRARPVAGGKPAQPSPDPAGEPRDDEDDGETPAGEREIDILNSFYTRDIERALQSLERGESSPMLAAYLCPAPEAARLDLYEAKGRAHLLAALQPARINRGHWLDEPQHAMSLMQQFAIHSVDDPGAQAPLLFSVNGPPGTGKTTLLRDLMADKLTCRARRLATLKYAGDAFAHERVSVEFEQAKACRIAVLREEFTGFEMVVASTNNAAVDNLARDLPKAGSLGRTAWRDEAGMPRFAYLQPVAHKLAARSAKGHYAGLKADDVPWGLFSCALGNSSNRRAFAEAFGSPSYRPGETLPEGFDPARHQSIWEWRKRYKGVSFQEAKRRFLQADAAVSQRIGNLSRHADLFSALAGQTRAGFMRAQQLAEQHCGEQLACAQAALQLAGQACHGFPGRLQNLRAEARLIETGRPAWWWRFVRPAAWRRCREELAANHLAQRVLLQAQREGEETLARARQVLDQARTARLEARAELAARQAAWEGLCQQLDQSRAEFPEAKQPAHPDGLEEDTWQTSGLWHDPHLNRLRSELFAAALGLHEAWLADVISPGGGFGPNVVAVTQLLRGRRLVRADEALPVWQSLFMMVPVVSSTFASVASQFRDLGPASLGWLFIDEAGQAVPQAAVGALWRARRAVVVGDPRQIEPVFTVPIKLIEAIAGASRLPDDADVAPHRVSVQNLADAANPLGARVGPDGAWVGSPLRAHRRCVDPMFSVANTIAYEQKMIFFDADPRKRQPPADSLDLGRSAWVHVPGAAVHRQSVPGQVHLVLQALVALYLRTGVLPGLYVVSPFKRIQLELVATISNPDRWRDQAGQRTALPGVKDLRDWCRERIGTVHTFQGRQESVVWMVLGCDQATLSAAQWAAAKPNLLNVALTRAQHRFFMIGDADLWGGLSHFDVAREALLPVITADEFVQRMEVAGSQAWSLNAATTLQA